VQAFAGSTREGGGRKRSGTLIPERERAQSKAHRKEGALTEGDWGGSRCKLSGPLERNAKKENRPRKKIHDPSERRWSHHVRTGFQGGERDLQRLIAAREIDSRSHRGKERRGKGSSLTGEGAPSGTALFKRAAGEKENPGEKKGATIIPRE